MDIKKEDSIGYWLNPCHYDEIVSRLENSPVRDEFFEISNMIETGKNLTEQGEYEKALKFFEGLLVSNDEKAKALLILQYWDVLRIALGYCDKMDNFAVWENLSRGSDLIILIDKTIGYKIILNYIESSRKEGDYYIEFIIKGFVYMACLGKDEAFDKIISLCNDDSLPGIEKEWGEEWRKIKSRKKELGYNIVEEVSKWLPQDVSNSLYINLGENQNQGITSQIHIDQDKLSPVEKIKLVCTEFVDKNPTLNFKISEKLLKNLAISNEEEVYLAHDDTILHSGKDGYAITNKGFYCRLIFQNPIFLTYERFKNTTQIFENTNIIFADEYSIAYHSGLGDEAKEELISLYQYIKEVLDQEDGKNGLPVLQEEREAVEEQSNVAAMFCTSCGKKIEKIAKFCNYCGAKVTYVTPEEI